MAATRKAANGAEADTPMVVRSATISDRIAAFKMLDNMGAATLGPKALRLSLVGFRPQEIAEMLQTTSANVSQALYMERKKTKNKAPAVANE